MPETVRIPYDGGSVEVVLDPCRHCKAPPTAEDAEKAVAHERRTVSGCAVCGGKPKLAPKYKLYHSVGDDGREGFILCSAGEQIDQTWHSDWVTISSVGPAGYVQAAFHVTCLKRVAPGIKISPR